MELFYAPVGAVCKWMYTLSYILPQKLREINYLHCYTETKAAGS